MARTGIFNRDVEWEFVVNRILLFNFYAIQCVLRQKLNQEGS